jgi:hypothetical protein
VFATISDRLSRDSTAEPTDPEPLCIDRYLADYDAVSRRHLVVDAPPGRVYETRLSADLADLGPVADTLGVLRSLPARVRAWLCGSPVDADQKSFRFGDLPTRGSWVRLADTGDEFVFGAVGTLWRPDIEWVELTADAFDRFDRPGYATVVAGFSVRPYGRGRTLLTYEARTAGTDPVATRRFGRYWRVVGPFVGYVLGRVLLRVKSAAEADDG